MDLSTVATNFVSPPILFFLLGMLATLVRSDLELPAPLPKVLSLYLLFAIGFRGGSELAHNPIDAHVAITLVAAILAAVIVPIYAYAILRLKLDVPNAAAIAATYGSISAVTFITAANFLDQKGVAYSGHMVAAMALMESPAIVVGVLFARLGRSKAQAGAEPMQWNHLIRDAFLNGSVFLLVGALIIGWLTGARGEAALAPFTNELFQGALALFLLDMGIVAARRLGELRRMGWFLPTFAIVVPLTNAFLGLGVARLIGLSPGDALLFMTLCASASYIAVPAAMRLAVPEANPSLYVTLSLAITFPLHIIVGIPFYQSLVNRLWS
jgi:uncharacterized protein